MLKEVHGQLSSRGLRVAVVAGRFNGFIVDQLVRGVVDAVVRTGGREEDVVVHWVPGAFEIPQLLRRVASKGGFDCAIAVGAVIRGATPHFEHVANAASSGVAQVAATAPIPISFGVLTCDSIEQAIERAGTKAGNKGFDAAMAAIEMVSLFRAVDG